MFDNKYPYTDFHELNLDWFMGEFKKLVAEWEETKGEWNTLHDYVQNYFESLNVQTEIDNKINAMILDGTFADIVSPFVTAALPALVAGQLPDVVAAQISSVVAAQISAVVADQLPTVAAAAAAQEVSAWLAAHIDPDTGYVIDDSLTVSQAAADAKTVGDEIDKLKSAIETLDDAVMAESIEPYVLNIQSDGYYNTTGQFVSSSDRRYAIISPVSEGETYYLTTYLRSTAIPGIEFFNNSTFISYQLPGDGTDKVYTDYEITIPTGVNKLIVQNANLNSVFSMKKGGIFVRNVYTKAEADSLFQPIGGSGDQSVYFKGTITVNTDSDLIPTSTATLSTFTGDFTNGFTHPSGTDSGRIQIYNATVAQGNYILEFDTTYTAGECVRCGFANDYKNYAYNGGSHIIMPIANTDGDKYLYINSVYAGEYTLTNFVLRKINTEGSETVTLTVNTTLNINNTDNLGFWNVILGYNTADNAVGSTRMIAIGNNALAQLQGGHRNIGIGTFAMSQMTGGEGNVSMGADSMLEVQRANHNVAIGREACYKGTLLYDNVAVGHSALFGASGSESYYNVAVGSSAGAKATGHWGTFVGYQAGYNITSGYGNTMLGFNTLGSASGYDNTCVGKQASFNNGVHGSTAIGTGAVCTKSNQVIIGGSNVTEFVLKDKKIIFNEDGTVSWEAVN